MKQITLALFGFFCLITSILSQTKKGCFEIKYLDFFDIETTDTFKWSSSELDKLLEIDFKKEEINRKTNFLIPMIVFQLKDYHPSCSNNADTATFKKLQQLYFKIRQQGVSNIHTKSTSKQLELIRKDFYSQVLNDSLLPSMGFTLDDGPFYGQPTKHIPDYKNSNAYKAEFGTLYITKHNKKILLTVINSQKKHLWTRIMTGNAGRYLTEINFSEKNINKTSLGYQLRMFSEGEALNLYLKSNGDLRYYVHSW